MCSPPTVSVYLSHVSYEWVTSHMNESRLIWKSCLICLGYISYAWLMSHMNESCHIRMSHVSYEWVMSHMHESRHVISTSSPRTLHCLGNSGFLPHRLDQRRVMCAHTHCITKDTYGVATITHSYVAWPIHMGITKDTYGVATISRLLKIIRLSGEYRSLLWGSFAKETYNFKEPTHCSRPIQWGIHTHTYTHTGSYQRNIRWEKFKKKVGGEIKTMSIWWLRLVGSLKS